MTDYGRIRSDIKPEDVVIDDYSAWLNSDIAEVEVTDSDNETHTEYEYNQLQYTKDEYIELLSSKNAELESTITDTQIALCEVYEALN